MLDQIAALVLGSMSAGILIGATIGYYTASKGNN